MSARRRASAFAGGPLREKWDLQVTLSYKRPEVSKTSVASAHYHDVQLFIGDLRIYMDLQPRANNNENNIKKYASRDLL